MNISNHNLSLILYLFNSSYYLFYYVFQAFSFKLAFCFTKMILISIFISVTGISVYMILFEYISDMNIGFANSDSIVINYQEWFFHSAPSFRRSCWVLLERRCPSKDDYKSRFDYSPFFMIFI